MTVSLKVKADIEKAVRDRFYGVTKFEDVVQFGGRGQGYVVTFYRQFPGINNKLIVEPRIVFAMVNPETGEVSLPTSIIAG